MQGDALRQRVRALVLVAILGLLASGIVSPAAARAPQLPTVQLASAAGLAPDGLRALTFAFIEFEGISSAGVGDEPIQIVT